MLHRHLPSNSVVHWGESSGCLVLGMPSASRSGSAVAVVDVETSQRAKLRGIDVAPGRVRRWRLGGLIPAPDAVGTRPAGTPPGRSPLSYSPVRSREADDVVDVLVRHARRGRSQLDLALILFAHEQPVPLRLVRSAIESRRIATQTAFANLVETAQAKYPAPADAELRLDAGFERAEALARMALANGSHSAAGLRRNLRIAGEPVSEADLLQVLTRFAQMLGSRAAVPQGDNNADPSPILMRSLGMQGLLESAAPGVAPLLPDARQFFEAASSTSTFALAPLPADVSDDELTAARDHIVLLDRVLKAIPAEVLYYLGGAMLAQAAWNPGDPVLVGIMITMLVHVQRRDGEFDVAPLVDAVRRQGWLDISSP